ncbi:RAMP superfamily CRISPR-associated protein [Pseudonocardia alni]|uniref:RAMP superfamily CRISPR-associated protein n=1 Tax=Pseudonocardia alni TaxID=33907 RepID=UPI0033F49AAE
MTTLTITFTADWRVGTGAGLPGDLDAVVRRDADDLPVVPARTVVGLWRDGCERVVAALGGDWPGWIEVLFGRGSLEKARSGPRAAAVWPRTARLAPGVRAALVDDRVACRGLFGVRQSVAISTGTGQADPTALRLLETARSGLVLHAPVVIHDDGWTDAQRVTAAVLLALGAEEVDALGADRRRGLGACRWTFPVDEAARAVLDAAAAPTAAPPPPPGVPSEALAVAGGEHVDVTVDLDCLLVDPVLSTAVTTGQVARGLPIVPGGRLLPAVVTRLRRAGIEVEHLVARGGLTVSAWVPVVDDARGLPAPLSFAMVKGTAGPLYNSLRVGVPAGTVPRPMRDRWLAPADEGVTVAAAATEVRPHNVVHDPVQRPTTDVGGLYILEAIPAGTRLHGRVTVRVPADRADDAVTALAGGWTVGASRKDEYGRVTVTASRAPLPAPAGTPSDRITVWFLSDAVLVDDRLAPVTTAAALMAALSAQVGVDLVPDADGPVTHAVAFGRVDGWQSRWQRPRPTLHTVAAGSVLSLRRADRARIGPDLVAALARGVGERRVEGYGDVAIDHPLLDRDVLTVRAPDPDPPGPDRPEPDGADHALVAELRRTGRMRIIEEAAATLARAADGELYRLARRHRIPLRAALDLDDPTAAIAVLRRAGTTDADRLDGLIRGDAVWTELKVPDTVRDPELTGFAVRRLLAHVTAGGAVAGGLNDGA